MKNFKTTVEELTKKVVILDRNGKYEDDNYCPFSCEDLMGDWNQEVTVCLCENEGYTIISCQGHLSLEEIENECKRHGAFGYKLANYCHTTIDEYMWSLEVADSLL